MTADDNRRALLWRTEKRLAEVVKKVDAILTLHGPIKPTADNGLRRPICLLCARSAARPEAYPCRTRQLLERLSRELEKP